MHERHHSMFESYHRYPAESEWAVKWHNDEHGPKGWPAEANPLGADDPTPPGYERKTGKELNAIRAAIIDSGEHVHHTARWNARRLEEVKAEVKRVLDEQKARIEATNAAIQSGAAHAHIDSASSFEELRHRMNNLHEAHRA